MKRSLPFIFICAFVAATSYFQVSFAQSCITDQSYLGSDTRERLISSTEATGQSFRAGITGYLNSVSLDISASNSGCAQTTMDVKIDILDGDGTGGSLLASQVYSLPVDITRTLEIFTFNIPASIIEGQMYTLVATLVSGQDCGSDEPELIWYYEFPTDFWTNTGGTQYFGSTTPSLGNTQYFSTCVGCWIADQTVSATATTLCENSSTSINLASSQTAINYFLRKDADDSIIDGPIAGTGAALSLNTGAVASTTTYNVYGATPDHVALDFDGVNDLVNLGNQSSVQIGGTEITLEAWIYPTGWRDGVWEGNIINKENNSPDYGYMLRCGDDGNINFNLGDGGWNEISTTNNPLTLNTWQHVAATYNGTTMSIYLNGTLIESQSISTSFSSGNADLIIGNWSNGSERGFVGKIDEVRVWNIARTQEEISANMLKCLTGSEGGLVAYHQFENNSGTTSSDLTSNANDGVLVNMDATSDWVTGKNICGQCDLEMTQLVTITINAPTKTISIDGNTLTADEASAGATYQWLDCNNSNTPVDGATNQSYSPGTSGNFAVEVTKDGCTSTSVCQSLILVGLGKNTQNQFSVYPNPAKETLTIDLNQSTHTGYIITNLLGKVVKEGQISSQRQDIDVSNLSKGMYVIKVGEVTYRFIKE